MVACGALACGRFGFSARDGSGGDDGGALDGDGGVPTDALVSDAFVTGQFTGYTLPTGASVSAIARATDGTLYAIAGNARVFRLAAGSTTWTACASLGGSYLLHLAIDASSGAIYVSGAPEVFVSTNACAAWTSTAFNGYASPIAVLAGRVLAGASDGVYAYNGTTWTELDTPANGIAVYELQVDAAQAHVFNGAANGFARSLDGGTTWEAENTGLAGEVELVATAPTAPTRLAALAGNGGLSIYLSTDTGATWTEVGSGGFTFGFDSSEPTFGIYAAYGSGDVTTTDGAMTFGTADTRSTAMDAAATLALTFDGSGGVYAGTARGVFYAPDHALAWSELDDGLDAWQIDEIATSVDGTIYLGTGAGVLRSSDAGATWATGALGIGEDAQVMGIAPIAGAPASLIVASANNIYRSDDHGQSYSTIYQSTATDEYQVLALAFSGTTLIAGTGGGIVTAAPPWTTYAFHQVAGADRFVSAVLPLDTTATELVVGSSDQLFYSSDGGATFTNISTGLPADTIDSLAQLADGTLLVGLAAGGVYRASAPGATWTATGLANTNVSSLATVGTRVFAAAGSGVYSSSDGMTWQLVPGLEHFGPRALGTDASHLFIGTTAYGLFSTPLP